MKHIRINRKYLIAICLSIVIPVIILALAYYKNGIYPGGPNTVLTFDLKTQYMPFFASLKNVSKSDNSIFFNISGALGNNFWGFAYYIFSPFTWLTVIFPLDLFPVALYLTYLLRVGLCGFGFCYYLLYTYEEKHYLGAVLLSCCYALMSYNIGYSINLMWVDAVLMLPWILTGVERVIRGKKKTALVIAVLISMICNYYITCMSLIFTVLYSTIRLGETNLLHAEKNIKENKESSKNPRQESFIRREIRVINGIMLGVGLSLPIVFPGVIALRYGKLDEEARTVNGLFRYNIIGVLSQLFSGKYDTVMDDGLPLLFCGTGTLFLVLLYFIDKKTSLKIKLLYFSVIIFYFFSMCFIPIDQAMHGFKEPTCFEVRYSFAFSCLLLIIAYKGVGNLVEIANKYHLVGVVKYLAAAFVLLELVMNTSILISEIMVELHYDTATEYKMVLESKKSLLDMIEDEGFYRVSDDNAYTDNDGAWLGYNGFGYFSSCYNLALMNFLGSLGECQNHHILEDHDRTPLEENLFGAKYKLTYAGGRKTDEIIGTQGFYTLSENNDALSLGYMIDYKDGENVAHFGGDALENQNILAKELSGINENVFTKLEQCDYQAELIGDIKHISLKVVTQEEAPVWIYIEKSDTSSHIDEQTVSLGINNDVKGDKLYINGGDFGEYKGNDTGSTYVMWLGTYKAGEEIAVDLYDSENIESVYVDYFSEEGYHSVIEKLKQNQLSITEHSSGHFLGTIDAGLGGNLLLSLPAIEGWRIKVDGKRVDPGSYRDVLLTVPLSAGMHEVDIRYFSPGITMGTIFAVLTVFLSIIVDNVDSKMIRFFTSN